MKLVILISCILANGQFVHGTREYPDMPTCVKRTEYLTKVLYPTYHTFRTKENGEQVPVDIKPLCWCHKGDKPQRLAVPVKRKYEVISDDDRKSPKPQGQR